MDTTALFYISGQFEAYKNKVDDRSMKVGGKQWYRTNDGYVIPLDIINGLPYLKMQPPNDAEMNALPHVIFTSGDEWNSTHPDHSLTDKEDWYNVIKDIEDGLLQTLVRRIRQLPQSYCTYACYRSTSVPNSDIDGLTTGTEHTGIAAFPLT
jgi:hypothetical protein